MKLNVGMRLRSQVCSTEVVVIRASPDDIDLRCGGHPMVGLETEPSELEPVDGLTTGSPLGKRLVTATATTEVLVTKAGTGTLSVGDEVLRPKDAKPLPASD